MLVLSRQRDETIMIGDDIEITIVDIRGDKVRLGINAPTRIAVHRKEVYDAIKAENQRAAQFSSGDLAIARADPSLVRPRIAAHRLAGPAPTVSPASIPLRPTTVRPGNLPPPAARA
jgi:carbon storage regulator